MRVAFDSRARRLVSFALKLPEPTPEQDPTPNPNRWKPSLVLGAQQPKATHSLCEAHRVARRLQGRCRGFAGADFRRLEAFFRSHVPGRHSSEPCIQSCHVPRFRWKPEQTLDEDRRVGGAGQNAPWHAAGQGEQPRAYAQVNSRGSEPYAAGNTHANLIPHHCLEASRSAMGPPSPPCLLRHDRNGYFEDAPRSRTQLLLQINTWTTGCPE